MSHIQSSDHDKAPKCVPIKHMCIWWFGGLIRNQRQKSCVCVCVCVCKIQHE